jgi:outer membrane receptor protein involved in Fe transport
MNELYWPEDNFAAGNPDLKSESNLTIETGLRYLSRYFLKLGCFGKIGEKIIIWRPSDDGKWRPFNTGNYFAQGGNIELSLDSPLKISFGYSFTSVKIDNGVLPYRPEHSVILNLEKYGFYTESMGFIKRPANPSGLLFLDDIFLINFGYHLKKKLNNFILEINPKIKNILDKNYQFVEGYTQPGREYEITIKIKEAK